MKKVNDWDARFEMNKHVIDWMCKKWDDWDVKSKMNAKNLDESNDCGVISRLIDEDMIEPFRRCYHLLEWKV